MVGSVELGGRRRPRERQGHQRFRLHSPKCLEEEFSEVRQVLKMQLASRNGIMLCWWARPDRKLG
jgi:hypothetical protein